MQTHIVERGECLASIAWMYGFDRWETLYQAPENEAFRDRRPNPNVIHAGDELVIPDKRKKEESGATEKRHRFRLLRSRWRLRIEIRDESNQGLENAAFKLVMPGEETVEGRTGKNGLLEASVPASAESATLFLLGSQIELRLGGLDPVRQVTGVQQRLNNLGFDAGPVDGIPGSRTRRALAAFQATQPDLDRTGLLDDDTLRRLLETHDNDKRLTPPEENTPPEQPADPAEPDRASGEGGWDGKDMVCHAPDHGQNATLPKDFYFAIYYVSDDGSRAFERASETWRREAELRGGFAEDRFLAIEVKTEEEFRDAWQRIDYEARQKETWIHEGHVFTHASLMGNETGLEFSKSTCGATLTQPEIEALPQLPWRPGGRLVLHGCNSGVSRDGWSPAGSFARRQGVVTFGQAGSAFFSQRDDVFVEINASTKDVYLRAFYHGRNVAHLQLDALDLYGSAMKEFVENP